MSNIKEQTIQWIDVKKQKPQDGRYLVIRFDYVTKTPFVDILNITNAVWWALGHHVGDDYAVRYWAKLPDIPQDAIEC